VRELVGEARDEDRENRWTRSDRRRAVQLRPDRSRLVASARARACTGRPGDTATLAPTGAPRSGRALSCPRGDARRCGGDDV